MDLKKALKRRILPLQAVLSQTTKVGTKAITTLQIPLLVHHYPVRLTALRTGSRGDPRCHAHAVVQHSRDHGGLKAVTTASAERADNALHEQLAFMVH